MYLRLKMLGRSDLEILWLGMLLHSWASTAQGGTQGQGMTHMRWTDMHLGFSKEAGRKKTIGKSCTKIKG
jgi:hypothetical protein